MNGSGPRVLVVMPAQTFLGRFLAEDLRASGFDVEEAHRGPQALDAAKRRPPAAIVTGAGSAGAWLQLLGRNPELAAIPLVAVARPEEEKPRFLPFFTPVRWDAVVPAQDAHRHGLVAAAVREAIARGRRRSPTQRERLGLALSRVGSALVAIAFALLLWRVARVGVGDTPASGFGATSGWVPVFVAGHVSGDVGTRLARGSRPGLSRWTWFLVVVAGLWVLLATWRAATMNG